MPLSIFFLIHTYNTYMNTYICMYVHEYIHIYTYIHIYVHTYIQYIHTYMNMVLGDFPPVISPRWTLPGNLPRRFRPGDFPRTSKASEFSPSLWPVGWLMTTVYIIPNTNPKLQRGIHWGNHLLRWLHTWIHTCTCMYIRIYIHTYIHTVYIDNVSIPIKILLLSLPAAGWVELLLSEAHLRRWTEPPALHWEADANRCHLCAINQVSVSPIIIHTHSADVFSQLIFNHYIAL